MSEEEEERLKKSSSKKSSSNSKKSSSRKSSSEKKSKKDKEPKKKSSSSRKSSKKDKDKDKDKDKSSDAVSNVSSTDSIGLDRGDFSETETAASASRSVATETPKSSKSKSSFKSSSKLKSNSLSKLKASIKASAPVPVLVNATEEEAPISPLKESRKRLVVKEREQSTTSEPEASKTSIPQIQSLENKREEFNHSTKLQSKPKPKPKPAPAPPPIDSSPVPAFPDDDEDVGLELGSLKVKKNVFVRSEGYAWLPARILDQMDYDHENDARGYAQLQVFDPDYDQPRKETVDLREYAPHFALPLKNVNEYGDMIDLPFLHEPGILYNLQTRFMNDRPYTRTGDILIAVNPYQWLTQIYTTEKRKHYMPDNIYDPASGMVKKSTEPHVYEVSAMAYRGLAVNQKNQSILVSGESGAGKTESVKILLDQIASIQGGLKRKSALSSEAKEGQHQVMSKIVQKVVDSNPLLEAFGNAKTVRNDNSSRFGKFVKLQFEDKDGACTLVGSHIEVYLLEKSRVISHTPNERNYHIFYQLLAAPDAMKRQIDADVLVGMTTTAFPYLQSREKDSNGRKTQPEVDEMDVQVAGMSDAEAFEETRRGLEMIGIQNETFLSLMRALCAVLQLSTIQFVANDDDNATIPNQQTLHGGAFAKLAHLMGIDTEVLATGFTNKTIMAGGNEISSPLSPQLAKEGCDAFAKYLYSNIFAWLVSTINAATSASSLHTGSNHGSASFDEDETDEALGLIGVLDIFGFESFETNGFEQLCINYCNERLQYMFASNVFVTLIDEYSREGLVENLSYETNTDILELIHGKVGILATMNEECIRPGGSDVEFVFKALNQNKSSARMFTTKLFTRLQFGIRHYAGPVVYTAGNFCATNKDSMPVDLIKIAQQSPNEVIAFQEDGPTGDAASTHRSRTNMTKNTVVSKFRTQLNSLMKTLSATSVRYIRCIKPNSMKQPRQLENFEVLRQLSSGGVIAAIKIASASYPNKMEHHAVLKRFRNLGIKPDPSMELKDRVQYFLSKALTDFVSPIKGSEKAPFTVGNTRTYFRTGALEYLENARNDNIGFFAIIITTNWRMAPHRRAFLRKRNAAILMEALIRGFIWRRRVEKMPQCALVITSVVRCVIAKLKLRKQKSAVKIQRRWHVLRQMLYLRRCRAAAIGIQTIARGKIQRQKYQSELAKKTKAITKLQSTVRTFLQRSKFLVVLEEYHTKRRIAATEIQKIARGRLQHRRFQVLLREYHATRRSAAIDMQRVGRGYVQRVEYQKMLKAEHERIAAEKAAKEARLLAERLAQDKAAEEERLAAEKAAEEARLLAERLADEERQAEAARQEAKRMAQEKQREAERLAEEKRLEKERLAEEARLEAKRIAEEKRLEKERLAEEARLEAERIAEEKRLEEQRIAEERRQKEDDEKAALMARLAEMEKAAEEARLQAQKEKEELEMKLALAEQQQSLETLEMEEAIRAAQERADADNAEREKLEEDEELELALEMALLAGQNPNLKVSEIKDLLEQPELPDAEKPAAAQGAAMISRFAGTLWSMATGSKKAEASVIEGAPWGKLETPSLAPTLSNTNSRNLSFGRSSFDDDLTFDEFSVSVSVCSTMLSASQLRTKREKMRLQQQKNQLNKKSYEQTRTLRAEKKKGDRTRKSNLDTKRGMMERLESIEEKYRTLLQTFLFEETDQLEVATSALESESVKLGFGSFESQKEKLDEEEILQFDVMTQQEAQLAMHMKQMKVLGQQKFLLKKHQQVDVEYLTSCKDHLTNQEIADQALEDYKLSLLEMETLYGATLRKQEAAFARVDADMTIRESIEDLF